MFKTHLYIDGFLKNNIFVLDQINFKKYQKF